MWPLWTEEGKKQRKVAQRPALLPPLSPTLCHLPPCLAPGPYWAGSPGWAGYIYLTFTCTKGWSPGAPSRTTAGECCSPGELRTAWGVGREGSSSLARERGKQSTGSPLGFLVNFWAHSSAFKALLHEAPAELWPRWSHCPATAPPPQPHSHLSPVPQAAPTSPGSISSPGL